MAPAAVAAGFMAVAGVLVVTQMPGGTPDAPPESIVAQAPETGSGMVPVSAGPASGLAGDPPTVVLNGQLIRDVRLDEYLAAHKKFAGCKKSRATWVLGVLSNRDSVKFCPTHACSHFMDVTRRQVPPPARINFIKSNKND